MFYGFSRLRGDIFCKLLISMIAVYVIVYIPNYGKLVYKSMTTVTNEMINQGKNYQGYQPGGDIVSANSIADMDKNDYFTIEVSKNNIIDTGYHVENLNSDKVRIAKGFVKYLNKFYRNIENKNAVHFCIVTLSSGEKCIVVIDTDLINVSTSKVIKLPIGIKDERAFKVFGELPLIKGVTSEGCDYFVDTTCYDYYSSAMFKQLSVIKGWAAIIIFLVTYVIFTKLFKKLGYESEVEMIRKLFKSN